MFNQSNYTICGISKHHIILKDMITLPFFDNILSFFINNIDNHPKNKDI